RVVDPKEVYLTRAAGRVAHARHLLAMDQPIEERRLADVRAAGERDLRESRLGTPAVQRGHAADELQRPNDERVRRRGHQFGATAGTSASKSARASASESTSSIVFTAWNVIPARTSSGSSSTSRRF